MGRAVGAFAGAGAVGQQLEHVPTVEVSRVDRHVARVGLHRRPRSPEEEVADAPLVRDEVDAQIGAEVAQLRRCLDPPLGGDQEVALGRRRQVFGVPVAIGRRPLLGRAHHRVTCSHAMARLDALNTPALVVDSEVFEANLAAMAAALPGTRCRPHVKAHKTTAIAHRQRNAGHLGFTCATPREMHGLAAVGLGDDLLLANEVVDAGHLEALASLGPPVTVAVDSEATIEAAAGAGLQRCLIDVNVGLPRCGCDPDDAGRLADLARRRGLEVRGVMGYEGHVVGLTDRAERERQTAECMAPLARAHEAVGGEIISAGGTGTYDCNALATEIQAGSYALMDTSYAALDLPFRRALFVLATVISVNPREGYAVADCGLKSLGMDHGDPTIEGAAVWFCSDEHTTFSTDGDAPLPTIGERVRVWPAHVDPTVAYHERMHVLEGEDVIDVWPVDLRGW